MMRILLLMTLGVLATDAVGTLLSGRKAIGAVTRHNAGDLFAVAAGASQEDCSQDTCVGVSSGTATMASGKDGDVCYCRCGDHLPAFRDDLHICVDDIHECALAPFVSSSISQQIPFVFLPLKGQIVHPSKEISFAGVRTPVCAISGAQFLTEAGWIDLRSPVDADVPFKLFRDEGRTFLQWLGDAELRTRMSGRLILVQMLCKDLAKDPTGTDLTSIFTPCVAFRVAGTPVRHVNNVSEVLFSAESHATDMVAATGLTVSEYVAIGICSVLLGLIYVASVFLYLHLRKRKNKSNDIDDVEKRHDASDVGVVKNNPLLGLGRHFGGPDNSYSDSNSSDDLTGDTSHAHDDGRKKSNLQMTSAVIHPLNDNFSFQGEQNSFQDSASNERLPEENVSIVETLEGREDPETVRSIVSATARRKLYFNPSYFEPHLLLAPPPAAIEFLTKIREVISIAKHKMVTKRFTPSLMGIPEEEHVIEPSYEFPMGPGSRRSSIVSLKRQNSRRKSCTGCPGCEVDIPDIPNVAACQNCASVNVSESKQQSIRRWLEDVPVLKPSENESPCEPASPLARSLRSLPVQGGPMSPKRLRSPTRSQCSSRRGRSSPETRKTPSLCGSDRSESMNKSLERTTSPSNRSRKSKAPPPPGKVLNPRIISSVKKPENKLKPTLSNQFDVIRNIRPMSPKKQSLPPPDMINEAIEIDKVEEPISASPKKIDYETDSLEKSRKNGYSTPTEYADVPSSQPSPSLSSALPLEEVMTMRNEIFNIKTGNKTISKITTRSNSAKANSDDHDYELIVLTKNNRENRAFRLPELLHGNNGYSLVSEVYVNNGYNYGSGASSRNSSGSSTLEKPRTNIVHDIPGRLTIQVEDCPDNYIRVDDSDGFEPDTLDRKPPKMKSFVRTLQEDAVSEYVDSLERPGKIMLKTTGSFKSGTISCLPVVGDEFDVNFNRAFGSLREIYEAKTRSYVRPGLDGIGFGDDELRMNKMSWKADSDTQSDEGRLLTLEERQKRRQRPVSPKLIPPDVIPDRTPIYEHPKPPRKVDPSPPPLPPKSRNGSTENKDGSSSPLSSLSLEMPSLADSSDPEHYRSKFEQAVHESKNDSILNELIRADDIIFKNGINNQFILQAATVMTDRSPFANGPFILSPKSTFGYGNPRAEQVKRTWRKLMAGGHKPEDSGYLSTDSDETPKKKESVDRESETDESLGDGHSESGAESIETHSVFFNCYRKLSNVGGSIDSGVGHVASDNDESGEPKPV